MTINLTKGKLVRWIITTVILFCGPSQAVDVPHAAVAATACREFFAGVTGYEDYSLIDAYEWKPGFFGVIMFCPTGIKETLIFDCRNEKR
jgi:hypothetical protein